jgi:L-cystine transport system substrate-binding protein
MTTIGKAVKWLVIALASVYGVTGCSSKESPDASLPATTSHVAEAVQGAAPKTKRTIVVGTYAAINKVSFYDDSGKLTGYDVEVVKEINKRLPQYQFKFVSMEFPNLFLSLDTRKIDFIAMHLEKNAARQEKYLFNNEFYDVSQTRVVVNNLNEQIHSIEDLKGKTVIVGPGSNPAFLIEDFNRRNQNAAKVVYGSITDSVTQIKSGRVDATVMDVALADELNRKVDARLKPVGSNLGGTNGVYFAFRKDEAGPASDIDAALREMKTDGTLNRLSQQWFNRNVQ